jgi:TPR repeat protein
MGDADCIRVYGHGPSHGKTSAMIWTPSKRLAAAAVLLLVPATALSLVRAAAPATTAPQTAVTALDAALAAYQAGNYAGARKGLKPLADRGSAIAETMLGVMAAKGEGGPPDPAAAAGWWLRAASRGYAPAQLALAKALADGHGVAQDRGQALVWARLAADGGNGDAHALAQALAVGFDAEQLATLEDERASWRPWPG